MRKETDVVTLFFDNLKETYCQKIYGQLIKAIRKAETEETGLQVFNYYKSVSLCPRFFWYTRDQQISAVKKLYEALLFFGIEPPEAPKDLMLEL